MGPHCLLGAAMLTPFSGIFKFLHNLAQAYILARSPTAPYRTAKALATPGSLNFITLASKLRACLLPVLPEVHCSSFCA